MISIDGRREDEDFDLSERLIGLIDTHLGLRNAGVFIPSMITMNLDERRKR